MSDWRSKPRNGKAAFMRHLEVIQAMLNAGETQNAIRSRLASDSEFDMSASQFSRHIAAFGLKGHIAAYEPNMAPLDVVIPKIVKNDNVQDSTDSHTKKPLTRSDLRKIQEDVNNIDLNALVSGKGVVYRE